MLKNKGIDIKGKTVAVSGFGNVAWGAVTKATELGAKVVTISGPDGYVYDPDGISGDKIDYMLELRASGNDIVAPYAEKYPNAKFVAGRRPWEVKVDIALPCATQNELNGEDACNLIKKKIPFFALEKYQTWVVLPKLLTHLSKTRCFMHRVRQSMQAA